MAYTRLFDILPHQNQFHPKEDCFAAKENGEWHKYSTEATLQQIEKLAVGLMLNLGLKNFQTAEEKMKVAIISNNRPEWNFADNALLKLGVVNVPIYPTITDEEMFTLL